MTKSKNIIFQPQHDHFFIHKHAAGEDTAVGDSKALQTAFSLATINKDC